MPTSYSRAAARALNCTRGHIGLCAIILMLMMSTLVWRQRDLVARQTSCYGATTADDPRF
uniref:Uncharacterized protein n=1 Tax=Fusarium oxysporum (strain Fo5176) TaxID=660025 RepID=A0A0D2XR26_FUSOF